MMANIHGLFTAGAVIATTTAFTAKAPVYAASGTAFVNGDELYSDCAPRVAGLARGHIRRNGAGSASGRKRLLPSMSAFWTGHRWGEAAYPEHPHYSAPSLVARALSEAFPCK